MTMPYVLKKLRRKFGKPLRDMSGIITNDILAGVCLINRSHIIFDLSEFISFANWKSSLRILFLSK
jgi:hypothetical protein